MKKVSTYDELIKAIEEFEQTDEGFLSMCRSSTWKVEEALNNGANINAKDKEGNMPLHYSVIWDKPEITEILLRHGADVNAKSKSGATALHYAARFCNLTSIAEIMSYMIMPDSENPFLKNPPKSRVYITELLLRHGADVNARTRYGVTPLHWAALSGQADVAEVLIENGADVNARMNDLLLTPLHYTAKYGSADIAELLLKHGADADSKDDEKGMTPLHFASNYGHADVAEVLINYGADVNSEDDHGFTALHMAAEKGHADIVEVLLKHGANINADDNDDNYTALDLAKGKATEILRSYIAKNEEGATL